MDVGDVIVLVLSVAAAGLLVWGEIASRRNRTGNNQKLSTAQSISVKSERKTENQDKADSGNVNAA